MAERSERRRADGRFRRATPHRHVLVLVSIVVCLLASSAALVGVSAAATEVNYFLRWKAGNSYNISQGSGNEPTHKCPGKLCHGIDFEMNGQEVLASAAGTLFAKADHVKGQTAAGTPDSWGNYVVIRHADGKCTRYAHLAYGSVAGIAKDKEVRLGTVLGRAGNTGYTIGPTNKPLEGGGEHLHFQREECSGNSIASDFVETDGSPVAGTKPVSKNPGASGNVDPASLLGSIVQWEGDTDNPKTSWLVGSDRRRRWIPSGEMYQCLRSKRVPDLGAYPDATLKQLPDLTNVWAECQTFWATQAVSVGGPYGQRVYYPLQFSFRIKNITRQPASIKRLAVAVRGPAGDPLDVQCQNGAGISLQPGQEFTCSAVLSTGYGSVGTYTMWADWMDYNDKWHMGELGQPTKFTLAGPDRTLLAVQSVSVGAPQGFRAFKPLQFSFRVRNVSGGAASIARIAVPVRGPSGNALDLTCAGGTNVTIPIGAEWTCSVYLGTGYGQAGTFTFWDDWMGFDNVWHAGQLGPMKTFTLSP